MSGSIQANTACEMSAPVRHAAATCAQIIREQIPNLFRLYLNPHVAQACYCLTEMITAEWPATSTERFQVFLANSLEESLSGAIKLARFVSNAAGGSRSGWIIDEDQRLEHFALTMLPHGEKLEYLPEIKLFADPNAATAALQAAEAKPGFILVFLSSWSGANESLYRELFARLPPDTRPLMIVCIGSSDLTGGKTAAAASWQNLAPDIVVFDESFVEGTVPFGAFAASQRLFQYWNARGMATFHSTTYQPNTIASLHFLRCLSRMAPDFFQQHQPAFERMKSDLKYRQSLFRDRYSPSLAKLISIVNLDQNTMRAAGHYLETPGQRIFDGVAGVACSIRGHNPPKFVEELEQFAGEECRAEVAERLEAATGLPHVTPAVSGASAVEHALKIGLAAKHPRQYVLALQGGFGGKTLFALTGTWKQSLKSGLAPLYPHVVYVDPFKCDAVQAIQQCFDEHPIGVIQFELIQGVGGVRPIPPAVLDCLKQMRQRYDCLLFVDEVQTGVYRTGPFTRSAALGLQPDLLAIGKGTSDMMFPFALTLHSDEVQRALEARNCGLPETLNKRYGFELGWRTVLNTLRRAEQEGLEERVNSRGQRFAEMLRRALGTSPVVCEVRCFGMLIGIELDVDRAPRRWLKRVLPNLYLLAMLRHRTFPLLVGFCQYEPNVLKITPPLSITEEEIQCVCETIAEVLRASLPSLVLSGAWQAAVRPRLARLFGNS